MGDARIFTLEEAERTLPLLRRILTDLRTEYEAWRRSLAQYELLTGGARADDGESTELLRARQTVTDSAARINGFLREIEAIGCMFKGFEAGLVDFYALRDDRLVFLCWQLGEERITHWHDVDAGFEGRQAIDSAAFSEVVP